MIIFKRAVARAKEIYLNHARAAAELRGDVGSESLNEILPSHVDRQEEALDRTQDLLESWGINIDKLKLALALTDITKGNPDVTFNALLAFEDRKFQDLPDTAVQLAMNPVGIELVKLICTLDRIFDNAPEQDTAKSLLRQIKGLANVLLHAEAGRLMVAETIEILAQTKEDLTGESGPDSATRREAFRLGAEVADQITGHDSFRAGFGKEVMPLALGAILRKLCDAAHQLSAPNRPCDEALSELDLKVTQVSLNLRDDGLYPASQNMEGFILQILDRLDALEPGTQIRYVKEGMEFQGKSLYDAISGGIHANLTGLRKIQAQLHTDIAESRMSEVEKERIRTSPYLREFEEGLDVFEQVIDILRVSDRNPKSYALETWPGHFVEIESFDQFSRVYPEAYNHLLQTKGLK